jgi:3-phosphoshikimate 1-carboxyvinyltransferase
MEVFIDSRSTYKIDVGYKNLNFDELIKLEYMVVIDQNVYDKHYDYLSKLIANSKLLCVIISQECDKSMDKVMDVLSQMSAANITKDVTLIAIGGGIVGDLAGFCASIYMRGIKFIQIPTTLLSQVDSSIGGKVGVNFSGLKNNVGAFYSPDVVYIDLYFLSTLSTRIFREGLVELIKHGFIYDQNILELLNSVADIHELRSDYGLLESLIKLSLEVKKYFVELDPYDVYDRHVLNYGHTYAHALELTDSNNLYHGECVMHGMLVMSMFDQDLNLDTNNKLHLQMVDVSNKFGLLKAYHDVDFNKIKLDKKINGSKVKEVFVDQNKQYIIKEIEPLKLIKCFEKGSLIIKNSQDKYHISEMKFVFKKSTLIGDVMIPPSKSYAHRYIIAACFANTTTILKGMSEISDDIKTTLEAIKTFGTTYDIVGDSVIIKPGTYQNKLITDINMHESATSLRLLLPLMLVDDQERIIYGENKLPYRPNKIYEDILKNQNIKHSFFDNGAFLPIKIQGVLKPCVYEIDGTVSSQFISGLLYALPLLNGDSKIKILNQLESRSYVEMTLKVLGEFGITIHVNDEYNDFTIKGNQEYKTTGVYTIEQDYSGRTFFEVANAIGNNDINIVNKVDDSIAGDREIIDIIKRGDKTLDLNNMIDSAPIMALYFSQNGGGTLINTKRLAFKESNRLQAIIDILDVAKIDYKLYDNQLEVFGGVFNGAIFNTHLDHRITMSLIIASTVTTNEVVIKETKSINKSFVGFLNAYSKLGGVYDEE